MDLDTLNAIAAEPGPEMEAGPELLDASPHEVQQAEQLFTVFFQILGAASPKVRDHYPPQQIRAIAEAWVPVAQKRGWDVGGWLKDFGPEIALGFALLPPPVLTAVLGKLVDWATGKEAPKPQAEAAPAEAAA